MRQCRRSRAVQSLTTEDPFRSPAQQRPPSAGSGERFTPGTRIPALRNGSSFGGEEGSGVPAWGEVGRTCQPSPSYSQRYSRSFGEGWNESKHDECRIMRSLVASTSAYRRATRPTRSKGCDRTDPSKDSSHRLGGTRGAHETAEYLPPAARRLARSSPSKALTCPTYPALSGSYATR
jgi:hypothetical protein